MFKVTHIQEPDGAVAKLEAEAGSTFIQLGVPALAVVMRLQTRLPRIKVRAHLNSSEGDRGDGLA